MTPVLRTFFQDNIAAPLSMFIVIAGLIGIPFFLMWVMTR